MKVTGRELDNLPCCTSLAQRLPNRAIPSEAIAGVERGSVHIDEHFGTCDRKSAWLMTGPSTSGPTATFFSTSTPCVSKRRRNLSSSGDPTPAS